MATLRVAAVSEPAPMKVAQISKPGGDFEIVEREVSALAHPCPFGVKAKPRRWVRFRLDLPHIARPAQQLRMARR